MKPFSILLILIVLIFGMMACDGEDGERGGVGPSGKIGGQGEQGGQGSDGSDGSDGDVGRDGRDGDDGDDGDDGSDGSDGRDFNRPDNVPDGYVPVYSLGHGDLHYCPVSHSHSVNLFCQDVCRNAINQDVHSCGRPEQWNPITHVCDRLISDDPICDLSDQL